MNAFDLELAVERLEGEWAAPLEAHGVAVIAAARVGAPLPPWPSELCDGRAARLAHAAAALGEPVLAARTATLARWSLAARLAGDRDVRAASDASRTLAGLAARHDALHAAAPRVGCADASALIAALYGAAPARVEVVDDAGRDEAPPALLTIHQVQRELGGYVGVRSGALDVITPCATNATIVAGRRVTTLVAAEVDSPSTLALAAHELAHGVYAMAYASLPLGLAAPPSRLFDEAIAAWAVRRFAPVQARRAARLHARLARFEARALGGEAIGAAWAAELGELGPSTIASLFDEPGIAIAYARADALALAPGPLDVARWGADGAALDPRSWRAAAAPVA